MSRPQTPALDYAAEARPPPIPDYQMIRPIGRGAYGEVWLARGVTGLLRAVKLVRRDKFGEAGPFEREFHGLKEFAAISLVASNQLALLHVGQNLEAGFFYYVMELADDVDTGRDIDIERYSPCTLRALQEKKRRLTTQEAVDIGVELARGLASLHSHGLIHRDIKPANIIFVGGTPKLADIGLVTAVDLGQSIIGTEGFIAPEGPGTPAADVYSAGKVLYELNTGLDRKAFPVLPSEAKGTVDHRRFLNLNEVVLRACAANPAHRYQSAEALLGDLLALQAGRGMLGKRLARWLSPLLFRVSVGLMVVGIAATGAWLWPKISPPKTYPVSSAGSRSIAVMPFANLSADSAFPVFADGMHEDLILRLAKIHELKVISRTSVLSYKEGSRNLKEIASLLGVAYVLEGTVRRDGTRVWVSVRLIDAGADTPIWAESYERDITDAFALQSELSQKIAERLQAKLTANERLLVADRPTQSADAYDFFLRARELFRQLGSYGGKRYEEVIQLCREAIARDPRFAEAYVQLSLAHSYLYRFSDADPSPTQLSLAEWAADVAERQGRNVPEARLARGVTHYLGYRDWDAALRQFRAAEADLPNDEQLQWWIGNVLRRLNKWDDAIRYFRSSMQLNPNPRRPLASVTAIQTMRYLRRFKDARDLAEAQLRRFPDYAPLQAEFAKCQFEIDGDRDAFLGRMDNLAQADSSNASNVLQRKYESAYRRGDWTAAESILLEPKFTGIGENPVYLETPVALHRALVAWFSGRSADIGGNAEQALAEYERANWTLRQQPWVMIGRARAYALLGKTNVALREAHLAWQAVAGTDAQDAAIMLSRVAEVRLILGRQDEALLILRRMMQRPADCGPQLLRWDPHWKDLAHDPRFRETLNIGKPL